MTEGDPKKNNVVSIQRSKKFKWNETEEDKEAGRVAREEESFLGAMVLASRTLGDVEVGGVRKLIIFERKDKGWGHSYVNIGHPAEIIEALAPLWLAATAAVGVDEDEEEEDPN